jgi:hypothetical protein
VLRELAPGARGLPAAIVLMTSTAIVLLIAYHVLLVYSGPMDWRITSAHAGYWADYLSTAIAPLRMPLLFLASGVAARLLAERMPFGRFAREHVAPLAIAFAFAVAVLIPLQTYVLLDEAGRSMGYLDYLLHGAPFRVVAWGVALPDFAQAWFLSYLALYALIVAAAARLAPAALRAADAGFARAPLSLVALAVVLWCAFVEGVLVPRFGVSDVIFADLGGHAKYAPLFLLGVLLGGSAAVWDKLVSARLMFAALAGAAMLAAVALQWGLFHGMHLRLLSDLARGPYTALALLGAAGFALWLTSKRALALSYAADAWLPIYMLHQTTLVLAADAVIERGWPLPLEFMAIAAAAFLAPLALYQALIRPVPLLRVLFGLSPARAAPRPVNSPAASP